MAFTIGAPLLSPRSGLGAVAREQKPEVGLSAAEHSGDVIAHVERRPRARGAGQLADVRVARGRPVGPIERIGAPIGGHLAGIDDPVASLLEVRQQLE